MEKLLARFDGLEPFQLSREKREKGYSLASILARTSATRTVLPLVFVVPCVARLLL